MRRIIILLLPLLLCLSWSLAALESVTPEVVLEPQGGSWLQFGASMALDGDLAAVAMPGLAIDNETFRGGVELIRQDSDSGEWRREALLTSELTGFALALALDGDTCVVAAQDGDGTVVIFENGTAGWAESARLTVPSSEPYQRFGASLALSGDLLLVGAPQHDSNSSGGAVFLYRLVSGSWELQRRYYAPASSYESGQFGGSVAITDQHLVIAAPADRYNRQCYVARRQGESFGDLTALAPTVEAVARIDNFGAAVDLHDDLLVIGSPWSNVTSGGSTVIVAGACWIFRFVDGSWQQQAEIIDPEPVQTRQLGRAVTIDASTGRVFCGGSGMVTGNSSYYGVAPGVVLGYEADASGSWQRIMQRFGDPSLVQDCYGDRLAADDGRLLIADVYVGAQLRRGQVDVVDIDSGERLQRLTTTAPGKLHGTFGGNALAWSDAELIVGEAGDSGHNNLTEGWGSVVVYRHQAGSWQAVQRLTSGRSIIGDNFGNDLAVDGDRLLVGAPGRADLVEQPAVPEAFLYLRSEDGWQQTAVLHHPDGGGTHDFGASVALGAEQAFVGAPRNSGGGMVVVFAEEAGAWVQTQLLRPAATSNGDGFGDALVVDGDRLVVAARAFNKPGAVTTFLFADGSWQRQPDPLPMDGFGGLALDSDLLAIGSPLYDADGDTNIGQVDLYRWEDGGWQFATAVEGPGGKSYDLFGESVLLRDGWLLVGGENDDRVTIFQQQAGGGWSAWQRFVAAEGDGGNFGQAMALSATGWLAVGMPFRGLGEQDFVGGTGLRRFSELATGETALRRIGIDSSATPTPTTFIEAQLDGGTPQAIPTDFETTTAEDHVVEFRLTDIEGDS